MWLYKNKGKDKSNTFISRDTETNCQKGMHFTSSCNWIDRDVIHTFISC